MDITALVAGASVAGKLISSIASSEETKSTIVKLYRKFQMRKSKYITVIVEDLVRSELFLDVNDDKYIVLNLEKILLSMNSDDENMMIGNLKVNNNDLYALQVYRQIKPILKALRRQYMTKTCVILLSSKRLAELLHVHKRMNIYTMTDKLYESYTGSLSEEEKRFHNAMRKVHKPLSTSDYDSLDELKRNLQRQFA